MHDDVQMARHVTVATFNAHHCAGTDDVVDLERTAGALSATEAEIIGIQELDQGLERSSREDQPALLAERMQLEVAFFPTIERAEGRYGLALATREPSNARFEPLPRRGQEEPRGAIVAEVQGLWVVVTHLARDRFSRATQTRSVARLARKLRGPLVLLGDLNQGPRALGPLEEAGLASDGTRHRTMPQARRRHVDHVLAGRGARVTRSWTIPTDASDHVPLVAEVEVG